MPNVKFVVNTIEREKEIVNMTRENLDFLKNNRIRFTWPEKSIEEEYNAKNYETYKEWIETEWAKREQGFIERLLTFFQRPAELQFTVEVSNYGPLGFYNAKNNTVTINLNTRRDAINTITHEMVHIMLEPFVNKYRLNHTRKEYIVDTILKILE